MKITRRQLRRVINEERKKLLSEMYLSPQAEIASIIARLREIDPNLAMDLEDWWDGIKFDLYPEPDPFGAMEAKRGYPVKS